MAYYEYCPEHNGIEIYFDERPDEEYLSDLRKNGWRWHRYKQCWYNFHSDENEEFAEEICDTFNEEYGYDEDDEIYEEYVRPSDTISVLSGNLIKCVDCGKSISSRAAFCVNCGAPMDYIKEEYEKERVHQQKIEEQKKREQAVRAQKEREAEQQRKLSILLAEKERIFKEREKEQRQKEKEKRIKDFRVMYEKDKDAFVSCVCDGTKFNQFTCYAFANGFRWYLSNGDGIKIEYNNGTKEMVIRYSINETVTISDMNIKEKICNVQKCRKEMVGIEDKVRAAKRQQMLEEMEREKERRIRNGAYRNIGTQIQHGVFRAIRLHAVIVAAGTGDVMERKAALLLQLKEFTHIAVHNLGAQRAEEGQQ